MSLPLLTRTWTELRDGRHRWGDDSAVVGRYGVVVRTLAVYPPGSTASDRRWLRAWRSAPMFAVVLFWLGLAGFGSRMPLPVALAATVLLIAGLFIALAWRCRRTRSAVVAIMSETPPGTTRPELLDRQAAMNRVLAIMRTAERRLADGEIDEVEFQHRWYLAYEMVRRQIGQRRRRPSP